MIVRVTGSDDGTEVILDDVSGFTSLHVEAPASLADDLGAALGPVGSYDGAHVWLHPDTIAALAGRAADGAWREGLASMVAFAEREGFTDADGAVRAHVEWAD